MSMNAQQMMKLSVDTQTQTTTVSTLCGTLWSVFGSGRVHKLLQQKEKAMTVNILGTKYTVTKKKVQ